MTENDKLLPIRFSTKADKLLRKGTLRRGDLTKRVIQALEEVDLNTVAVEERRKTPGSGSPYETTTILLPKAMHDQVKKVAAARGTSMSALIDGSVRAFFSPSGRSPASK